VSGSERAPRVRFAPSPTGFLHVGGARTALFNWLFARGNGGTFLLRIEDTDTERNREEWVDGIISSLGWLGLDPDEPPVRQSVLVEHHDRAIDALWENGFLYACDCSREEVEARTRDATVPGYDGHCRDRGLDRTGPVAMRFRTPVQGETVIDDVVRGTVAFPHAAMEDFVCVKSNGRALFVLANVVDDRDMSISHVIRGEDLLPTTPKGVLIWRALDEAVAPVPLPAFAHLPMLVNEQRKKLSKRREEVAVESYRDQGFLAEALRNYLALLGWSPPGEAEKVSVEMLIETFALEQVHHAPAFFDVAKLTHLNGEYIRELRTEAFVEACRPWVDPAAAGGPGGTAPDGGGPVPPPPPWPPDRFDPAVFVRMAPLVQERVATLAEAPAMVDFLFQEDPAMDEADFARSIAGDDGAPAILTAALDVYAGCPWVADSLHEATLGIAAAAGRKLAKTQAPIRVAVTGRRVGPPLFESLEVLGRDEVRRRVAAALARLGSPSGGGGGGGPDGPG
jgi:glutamyl-tRNA synthetase